MVNLVQLLGLLGFQPRIYNFGFFLTGPGQPFRSQDPFDGGHTGQRRDRTFQASANRPSANVLQPFITVCFCFQLATGFHYGSSDLVIHPLAVLMWRPSLSCQPGPA